MTRLRKGSDGREVKNGGEGVREKSGGRIREDSDEEREYSYSTH